MKHRGIVGGRRGGEHHPRRATGAVRPVRVRRRDRGPGHAYGPGAPHRGPGRQHGEEAATGTRRRGRLLAGDRHGGPSRRYGLLLLLLIAGYVLSAFVTSTWISLAQLGLFIVTGLLALRSSSLPRRHVQVLCAVLLAGSAVAGALAVSRPSDGAVAAASIWTGFLLLATVTVIVRRILSFATVTGQSIFGAVSAYLIIGFMFAAFYAAMGKLNGGQFFADGRPGNSETFQYFSFTTLTTLGYGDFTAAANDGRAIAVLEALTGQVFLATLVARLVSAFRGPRAPVPEAPGPAALLAAAPATSGPASVGVPAEASVAAPVAASGPAPVAAAAAGPASMAAGRTRRPGGLMAERAPEPGAGAGERELLLGWLAFHRDALAAKCDGMTPQQLVRLAVPPSDLSLLGLVRHLTEMERVYLVRALAGGELRLVYCTAAEPDGDIVGLTPDLGTASFDRWHEERAHADRLLAAAGSLDAVAPGNQRSVRWNLVKVIQEYARHNGHADLIRQSIDGAIGE
jgi:hypothetical protein